MLEQDDRARRRSARFCCADGSPVSTIALGTMYFGSKLDERTSYNLMDCYTSLGGNQIDTARSYASWLDGRDGTSERTIGGWLHRYGHRTALFLGSKGGLMPRGFNPDRGLLSYEHLRQELQASLQALHTDYLDVFWLHRDERNRPVEEVVDSCDALVREGLTRYVGASNWSVQRIRQANAYAAKTGKHGFSMSQIQFGLGVCTPENWGDASVVCMDAPSYDWYRTADLPLYAYSAQAQGFFSLYLAGGEGALSEDTRKKYLTPENVIRAQHLRQISETTGIPVPTFVTQYVLTRGFDAFLILGCSKTHRLREAFAALDAEIPKEMWTKILGKWWA